MIHSNYKSEFSTIGSIPFEPIIKNSVYPTYMWQLRNGIYFRRWNGECRRH